MEFNYKLLPEADKKIFLDFSIAADEFALNSTDMENPRFLTLLKKTSAVANRLASTRQEAYHAGTTLDGILGQAESDAKTLCRNIFSDEDNTERQTLHADRALILALSNKACHAGVKTALCFAISVTKETGDPEVPHGFEDRNNRLRINNIMNAVMKRCARYRINGLQ